MPWIHPFHWFTITISRTYWWRGLWAVVQVVARQTSALLISAYLLLDERGTDPYVMYAYHRQIKEEAKLCDFFLAPTYRKPLKDYWFWDLVSILIHLTHIYEIQFWMSQNRSQQINVQDCFFLGAETALSSWNWLHSCAIGWKQQFDNLFKCHNHFQAIAFWVLMRLAVDE